MDTPKVQTVWEGEGMHPLHGHTVVAYMRRCAPYRKRESLQERSLAPIQGGRIL